MLGLPSDVSEYKNVQDNYDDAFILLRICVNNDIIQIHLLSEKRQLVPGAWPEAS